MYGNVEGRDAFSGDIDILVTDGFTGNVFLKAVEGLGKFVKQVLKDSLMKNALSTIAAIPSMPAINRFAKKFDYKEYGGAPFLGVDGICIKAHGSSDGKAFKNAIRQSKQFYDSKVLEKIKEELELKA